MLSSQQQGNGDDPRCPSTGEWIIKTEHIHSEILFNPQEKWDYAGFRKMERIGRYSLKEVAQA